MVPADFNEQNEEFHTDLQKDIDYTKEGLLSFTIRVNNGVVSDYVVHEYEGRHAKEPDLS